MFSFMSVWCQASNPEPPAGYASALPLSSHPIPEYAFFYVQVWSSVDAKYKTAIHEKLTVLGSCRSCQAGQGESPNSTDKHCVQNAGERVFL